MVLTLPLLLPAVDPPRVELFLAIECPISNRYLPELNRIASLYQPRGVQFLALFPEPSLTEARLAQWQQDFKPVFAAQLDPAARRARKAGATLTPEAVVYQSEKIIYRGRIDDRFISWGKSRPEPGRRDLIETLDLLLAAKRVPPRYTRAFGCFIEM